MVTIEGVEDFKEDSSLKITIEDEENYSLIQDDGETRNRLKESDEAFVTISISTKSFTLSTFMCKSEGITKKSKIMAFGSPKSKVVKFLAIIKNPKSNIEKNQAVKPAKTSGYEKTIKFSHLSFFKECMTDFKINARTAASVRLFIDVENSVEKAIKIGDITEEATIYQIFDIPARRQDITMNDVMIYSKYYEEEFAKFKQN